MMPLPARNLANVTSNLSSTLMNATARS